MEPVPLLDLGAQYRRLRADLRDAIDGVVESQRFVLGPEVERFEADVAGYVGVEHAVGVASGTDALILSLAALGIGPGDEVVVPPFSFFATASCAVRVGARPVFADIRADSFNLDPERVAEALTARTRAVVPVHLFGQCADMEALDEVATRRGLFVVEDAAQALGASYRSAPDRPPRGAGSMGTLGCYSFFPSKNLGGFGDGGMVVTADPSLAGRVRTLRVHGEHERYHHAHVGWNSRLDALQAAVLRVKLPHLDAWCRARRLNADRYDRWLAETGLVGRGLVRLPVRVPEAAHIFNQYTLRVRDRDRLKAHLDASGIGNAVYYPVPLHLQACFGHLGYRRGDFPVAETAAGEVLSLPCYPELTEDRQQRVVSAIVEFYG